MAQSLFEALATIDHLDTDTVRQLVLSNKTSHQALLEIVEKEKKVTLFAEQLDKSNIIRRHGDIVVGLYSKSAVEYEISLGWKYSIHGKLQKQQFAYALFDQLPILLICTRYHETKIKVTKGDPEDMYIIYGFLDTDNRRFLAQNQFYTEFSGGDRKYMAYAFGMYHFYDSERSGFFRLPPWNPDPTVEEMKLRAKDRTCLLRKDFAESAWRPDRFMHWCLPFDEVPDDAMYVPVNNRHSTKLYLDNVILIEDAPVNMADIDPFLKSQGLKRVGHFNQIQYTKDGGLPLHKDNPLQGGEVSVVFYLNDADGGHIVFPDCGARILPKKGRCLIVDVDTIHYVEPIHSGTKEVLTCECVW